MVVKSSTSRTLATSVANTSSPSLNVRYCRVSVISVTLIIVSFRGWSAERAPLDGPAPERLVAFELLIDVVARLFHLESDSGFGGFFDAGRRDSCAHGFLELA